MLIDKDDIILVIQSFERAKTLHHFPNVQKLSNLYKLTNLRHLKMPVMLSIIDQSWPCNFLLVVPLQVISKKKNIFNYTSTHPGLYRI